MASFDLNRFKWKEDCHVPGRFIREPAAGELIMDWHSVVNRGEHDAFIGLYIKLSNPLRVSNFITYLREAWKSLRWEVPLIALQTWHVPVKGRPLPQPYMVYHVARSTSEVNAWAEATAILMEGYKDLDDLRYHVAQDPISPSDFAHQTYVYALQQTSNSFGILFRTSHIPFDGAGIKIIGTKLLYHLSNYIGDPDYQRLEAKKMRWGSESINLIPVMLDVIQSYGAAVEDSKGNIIQEDTPGEIRYGPTYQRTLAEIMDDLGKCSAHFHPFKSFIQPTFDVQKQKPRTRRLHYTFTLEESARIQAACAPTSSMPEKLTANNILLGCLSLLPILDNPPDKGSDAIVCFYGIIDARKRLTPEYRNYPGLALGMSPILLPVSLFHKHCHGDIRTLVLEYAKAVQREYKRQAAYPSLVSVAGEVYDILAQDPLPSPWSGYWFLGDGRGSVYLSPKYEVNSRQILEVSDFFLGVNKTDPGPCFRAGEWNGRINLSADFNELAVETTTVQRWMDQWRDLVLICCKNQTGLISRPKL